MGWSSSVVPPPAPPPAQAGPALAATVLYTFAGTAGDELAVEEGEEVLQSVLHCTECQCRCGCWWTGVTRRAG